MRAISSLIARRVLALLQLDSLLGEVFDRPGVPGDRRGCLFLVLELEVLRLLVDADQFFLVIEHRLDDAIGGFFVHVLRSEEGRVGEEGRSRWWPGHLKKKKKEIERDVSVIYKDH